MNTVLRWTREFSAASSFSDDLGALGAWVGPFTGTKDMQGTPGMEEDYVLRRVLVALHRQRELCFPFTVRASAPSPREPDFIINDDSGTWGLEVTATGSEATQRYDPCDLAVYDNINAHSTGHGVTESVKGPCRHNRFRRVFFVRDGQVHADVLSNQPKLVNITGDYNIDFTKWIGDQITLLRTGDTTGLDRAQLIEELSALAKSQRRALRSHLRNLLVHLLKWQFQPQRKTDSWANSINNARNEIEDLLMESPSLRDELDNIEAEYQRARKNAARETGLPIASFPEQCPFKPKTPEKELLREDWFPD